MGKLIYAPIQRSSTLTTPEGNTTNKVSNINSHTAHIQDPLTIILPGRKAQEEPKPLVLTLKPPIDPKVGTLFTDDPPGSGSGGGHGSSGSGHPAAAAQTNPLTGPTIINSRPSLDSPNTAISIILLGIASAIIYGCYKLVKYKLGGANHDADETLTKYIHPTEEQVDPGGITTDYNE